MLNPVCRGGETADSREAVIASGFSESRSVRETLRVGAGQYLKKPCTLQKPGMAIRTELAR